MSGSVRLCVVGLGMISTAHIQGAQKSGLFEITALVDVDTTKCDAVAKTLSPTPQIFTSLEDALKSDGNTSLFDAVELLLPHHLHAGHAQLVFDAGKRLLLEKPLDVTEEKCKKILEAADNRKDKSKVFMVGENSPYWRDVTLAKKLVDSGAIGELLTARAQYSQSLTGAAGFDPEGTWRADPEKAGGGATLDGGLHWLRPLKVWFGDVTKVTGCTAKHPGSEKFSGGETITNALLQFKNGKHAAFGVNFSKSPICEQPWFVLTGSKGEISIASASWRESGLILYDAENREGKKVEGGGGYASSFDAQLQLFGEMCLNGKVPDWHPKDAMNDVQIVLAIYKAAKTNTWVDVPEV